MSTFPPVSSVSQLKSLAKQKFKKEPGIAKLSEAQEAVARELKFRNWFHALQVLHDREKSAKKNLDRLTELSPLGMMILDDLDFENGPRLCHAWAGECEVIDGIKYYIPSLIFEDFGVQFPLRSKGGYKINNSSGQTFYYLSANNSDLPPTFLWSKSVAEIRLMCKQMNADVGLTESDAQEIIASALRALDRQLQ